MELYLVLKEGTWFGLNRKRFSIWRFGSVWEDTSIRDDPRIQHAIEFLNDTTIRIKGEAGRIGRDSENDNVILTDVLVSTGHCLASRESDGNWILYDPGSTNGTFVNGERIGVAPFNRRAVLQNGDLIKIGLETLQVMLR